MAMRKLPKSAGGILSYFTRHGTAANLLLVLMITLGAAAATQIRAQFFPDIIIDFVSVDVAWDGAGPQEIDDGIVALLEPVLLTVDGVESSSSDASQGRATISLDFEPGWDMARAADDVKVAVDAVTDLPDGIEEPIIRRGAWRDRVTDVVITGPVSPEQLGRFGDEFIARLFREGVTRTTIRGVSAPEITVAISERALVQHDITLVQVADAIAQEANTDPAGDVASGLARVKTGVEKRTAEDIGTLVVKSNPDGSKLRISDVSDITVLGADSRRAYFVDDDPAISIRVDRSRQGDAIRMQAVVQRVADEMQLSLPKDVSVDLIRTRSQSISDRLNVLLENGILGLALVIMLLFVFLNARTAFWVTAGIPAAMFAAIGFMYLFGITLNMVSLFGLIICLGIVVDDAIVVGEHADFRARNFGEDGAVAAENAARRMAPPVFSATVTTVLAFWSLTFVGGRFGSLIIDIPLTVIVVLLASLMECFIILPNHMSHSVGQKADKWYDLPSRVFNRGFKVFRDKYFRAFMSWVLIFRYPVLALMIVLLSLSSALFFKGDVTWRFFNAPERGSISGNIAMLPGADRSDTFEMMRELQRAVDETAIEYEQKHGVNPVTFVMAEIGGNTGRGLAGADIKDKDLLGSIAVELIDADFRPYTSFVFLGDVQEAVRNHPRLETVSFRGWRSGPGGDALDVQFFGASAEVLKAAAEALKTAVSQYPEVSALEDTLAYDKEELILELTPQGQALGFTIDIIGRELRDRLNGIEAVSFPVGARTSEVIVRLKEDELTADFLDRTKVRSPAGEYVNLSTIVTVDAKIGFTTVRRENGIRVVSVTGDISEDDPIRAEEITTALRTEILPKITSELGVEWRTSGLAEQEQDFLSDASKGLILCLLGIYLTLTWIFASWSRPFVVMSIIPFGLVGTIYGHYAWDIPLSMFSVVGLLGMTGIIINDSIVLVTTIDEYAEKRGLFPAIVDATSDRLRAVLLTTLTTVLGLMPLLFETSRQALFLKPTVITLCYGLGFGVVMVLLVVPSLVVVQKDISRLVISSKRITLGRRIPQRFKLLFIGAISASVVLMGATLGPLFATQTAANWVGNILPEVLSNSPIMATLIVIILGMILIISVTTLLLLAIAKPRKLS
ncbi:efflux RND transporter permease subunit [Amylibacter sp. SFDW26]|uniref:efflux RND transporter permease subunit n=1 Tax=Amylibacter sp. SFDW26 TaxID=2652722 RepID=UPI001261F538|nr:efflux RND transporter permease subunit [Amylibacter sp. SFDW26]KAB7613961.1 efflux RND transporter permease subunit [Amylibacter sp. SFDW26]